MRIISLFLLCFLPNLVFGGANDSQSTAKPLFTAIYKGEFSGWNIELTRQLSEHNGEFRFESYAKNLVASMQEISRFSIRTQQVESIEYIYKRKVFGRQTLESIIYDWPSRKAVYSRGERSHTHQLSGPTLDPSLYQLIMQSDLANQKEKLEYNFIKRNRQEHYRFYRDQVSQFTLKGKAFKAIVINRGDHSNNKMTRVWILPELDYQIAKILHRDEDGDVFQIELTGYESRSNDLMDFYKKINVLPIVEKDNLTLPTENPPIESAKK